MGRIHPSRSWPATRTSTPDRQSEWRYRRSWIAEDLWLAAGKSQAESGRASSAKSTLPRQSEPRSAGSGDKSSSRRQVPRERRPIQAESVGPLDSKIDKLSHKIVLAFKHHDLVSAGPAGEPLWIGFARPLAKNLHFTPNHSLVCSSRRRVDDFKQVLIPRFLDRFGELL